MEYILTSAVILAIAIGFPLLLLALPSTKGWAGEKLVAFRLKRCFPKEAVIFNDLYFHNGRRSCQIDHLVISHAGIFVVETKNYFGLVYGNAFDQYVRRKVLGMNYRTLNPAKQNERHIEYLMTNIPSLAGRANALHSIIVFAAFTRLRLSHNPGNIGVLSQLRDMISRASLPTSLSEIECNRVSADIRVHNRRKHS